MKTTKAIKDVKEDLKVQKKENKAKVKMSKKRGLPMKKVPTGKPVRGYKRSASAPKGSKSPFGSLKTDKHANAGKQFYPNVLSKTSPQGKLDTGKTLLSKAMRKMSRNGCK